MSGIGLLRTLYAILPGGVVAWWLTRWLSGPPALLQSYPVFDLPNERSSHDKPVVRVGGVGIVLPLFFLAPIVMTLAWSSPVERAAEARGAIWVLLGLAAMSTVGLIDDLSRLRPLPKLAGQLLATLPALVSTGGLGHVELPLLGVFDWSGSDVGSGTGLVLAALWVIGFTNCFNFLDGIDGMAGGCGALFSLSLGLLAWQADLLGTAAACLLLTSTCAGFLLHNFPPARIFMGDVGSLSVGYLLAVFSLQVVQRGASRAPFPVILLLLGPFLYDAGYTLCRRWRRGEPLAEAHRSHLYQRLVASGQSHRRVALIYYVLSLLGGLGALWYGRAGERGQLLLLGGGLGLCGGLTVSVWLVERRVAPASHEEKTKEGA
ncbi:MAG: glycosyltransferase family 4 protein [Blastocatellia bacterium]